jgi:hypothetical protein
MDIQEKLMQLLKYVLPAIGLTSILAVFVSWRFDNEADLATGETKDSFETVFKDEIEANLYKYSIIMIGAFVLITLLVKNLKK